MTPKSSEEWEDTCRRAARHVEILLAPRFGYWDHEFREQIARIFRDAPDFEAAKSRIMALLTIH